MVCSVGILASSRSATRVVTWDETGLLDKNHNPISKTTGGVQVMVWRATVDTVDTRMSYTDGGDASWLILSSASGGVTSSAPSAACMQTVFPSWQPKMVTNGAVLLVVITISNATQSLAGQLGGTSSWVCIWCNCYTTSADTYSSNSSFAVPQMAVDRTTPLGRMVLACRLRTLSNGDRELSHWRNGTQYRAIIAGSTGDLNTYLSIQPNTSVVHCVEYNERLPTDAQVAARISVLRLKYNC